MCEPEQALTDCLSGSLSGVAHSEKISHSLPSDRTDLRYHKSKRERSVRKTKKSPRGPKVRPEMFGEPRPPVGAPQPGSPPPNCPFSFCCSHLLHCWCVTFRRVQRLQRLGSRPLDSVLYFQLSWDLESSSTQLWPQGAASGSSPMLRRGEGGEGVRVCSLVNHQHPVSLTHTWF